MSIECVLCGEENRDGTTICINCGGRLRGQAEEPTTQACWVIVCPVCGRQHQVPTEDMRISECTYCTDPMDKREIAAVQPVCIEMAHVEVQVGSDDCTAIPVLTLTEIRKRKCIEIFAAGIIGRCGDFDAAYFAEDKYVSQYHCRLFFEDGSWCVEHLSETNPTAVNGTRLTHGIHVTVNTGDRLQIADLYFSVNVAPLSQTASVIVKDTCTPPPILDEELWEIVCPVCGKRYQGNNIDFRVAQCTGACADDSFDRIAIAGERPRKVRG